MKRKFIYVGTAILLLALVVLSRPFQVGIRTAAVFLDLGTNYQWHFTIPRNILISEVSFPCGNRDALANLYRPDDNCMHSGIILAHGAVKDGKDDFALTLAAQSLARAGYVVLIPQLEYLKTFQLQSGDVSTLIDSYQYLSRQPFVREEVGMLGMCLSAPLVLIAASDSTISRDIAVVSSWGGYYNVNDWLQAVLAEQYMDDGRAVSWSPRATLKQAVPRLLLGFLPDESERVHIQEMLKTGSQNSADVTLSPLGEDIYQLLSAHTPEQVKELWAKITPQLSRSIEPLSPHLIIEKLHTKIAIIHTATDDVIPWVESVKLSEAIPDDQEVFFKIFHRFYHVNIKQLLNVQVSNLCASISEAVGFYSYIYSIIYHL